MATAIFMPKQGMSMEEGTLVKWLKKVGDRVELNEPIMEIETDKIVMEAEAPASGIILAQLVEENSVVPVLETIGWIGEEGEKLPEMGSSDTMSAAAEGTANGIPSTPYAKKLAADEGISLSEVKGSGLNGEIYGKDVKATTVAKRLAANNDIDISSVQGSGFSGKVMKSDVEKAITEKSASRNEARAEKRVRLSGMRKVIAERMLSSSNEIPSAVIMLSADVTRLLALRSECNAGKEKEDKITVNDLVFMAVAKALAVTPNFRARIEGNELVTFDYVNLGCAISVDGGLLVPVVKDADRLTLTEIHSAIKDFSQRARSGKLLPDELKGSCFSVSNLGSYGVEFSTPIINQPDSGILGVGGAKDEFYLKEDGSVASRKMMGLSLSFDHRIVDGVPAAKFLNTIKNYLENPVSILI